MGLACDNARTLATWTDQRTGSPHAYFGIIWHGQ
jgi:hypothetical protein